MSVRVPHMFSVQGGSHPKQCPHERRIPSIHAVDLHAVAATGSGGLEYTTGCRRGVGNLVVKR